MTTKKRRRSKYAPVRHPFLYEIDYPDGTHAVKKAWAKVIKGTQTVSVTLTETHIRRSLALDGAGNLAKCAGAICYYDHRKHFSHPIVGWVDWSYGRVFVASKLDSHGFPCECYAYEHFDTIAKRFDTTAGQERLLARVQKHGPITLTLRPYRQRSKEGRPGRSRKGTGIRKNSRRLHQLRKAIVNAGISADK